ncbi:MAG: hypothetical protein K2P51_00485 [Rhabdochlamydiaceae bacterium]|nr:hypothetical protein [Rhabdochlamydiaceae bacterium]
MRLFSVTLLLLLAFFPTLELAAKKKAKIHSSTSYDPSKHTQLSLKALYNTLDPLSISEHLAFYELYPETKEGKAALTRAWELLNGGALSSDMARLPLPKLDLQAVISLVTRQSFDAPVKLNEEQLQLIGSIAGRLHNRKLRGSAVWTKKEVLALSAQEVDIARGLLIDQFEGIENAREEILQYEASIDLMALQIQVRIPPNATDEEKIRQINRFVFQEMQFRFPPHSIHAKEIDLYTFLPSVIDSRQGVCLGVSILYLALGQRLGLNLEIITPPGHIYVRYRTQEKIINIETTARGINLPSEVYLGINTRKLPLRNMHEVIGMAFVNQASVSWSQGNYETTVKLYEKALPYLTDDLHLKMFLGLNYLFIDKKKEGIALLKQVEGITFDDDVSPETLADDLLQGKADIAGIQAIFLPVDETRASIIAKQKELEEILKRCPTFRAGLLQLATTWLQLGRATEAQEILQRYHKLDPNNSTVEYYLSILSAQRLDYNLAWKHLKHAEHLTAARDHYPRALKGLRENLRRICPEP